MRKLGTAIVDLAPVLLILGGVAATVLGLETAATFGIALAAGWIACDLVGLLDAHHPPRPIGGGKRWREERRRYEISGFIGPCSEADAEAVTDAILDLPEWERVGGGGIGITQKDGACPVVLTKADVLTLAIAFAEKAKTMHVALDEDRALAEIQQVIIDTGLVLDGAIPLESFYADAGL